MMFEWLMKHADECSYKDKQLLDNAIEVAPASYHFEVKDFLTWWNKYNAHACLFDINKVVEEL